jgi:3-oxoacyl-[acyl-carrier protein] reductase
MPIFKKEQTMTQTLQSKRALVTGGSRGIGAAIVKRLAAEGAHVALTYVGSPEKAIETVNAAKVFGIKSIAIPADSADASALVNAVERTVSELGGIDILVNNAGILAFAPIDDVALADLDRTLAVNVRAVFVATQAAVRHMKEGGRIINTGSTNADRMAVGGGAVYAMSKSALQGLVRGLARDLGARGITINNVQPGPINTDSNPDDGPAAEMLKKQFNAIPRFGCPEEVAGMVAYLAGPEASYITGTSLTIDGGYSA